MDFSSDNSFGALPEILQAVVRAADGSVPSYGEDPITARLLQRMNGFFGREVAAFPVISGTAANSLALATVCPPHGAIFCHAASHIAVDECTAPAFFSHGARLITLEGIHGKIPAEAIEEAIPSFDRGVHGPKPSALSLTQATELGTVYTLEEIRGLAAVAHRHGMKVHMDGARLANALVQLDCEPAELTWKAGVDVLSFGASKNGALAAEAVVFFNPADARDFEYRRKTAGHLIAKMRFVSAQLEAYLDRDLWRAAAGRANAQARLLAAGLASVPGAEIIHPVETNAVFVRLPDQTIVRLRAAGARFYEWAPPRGGRTLIRLVCSFATSEADIARFVKLAAG